MEMKKRFNSATRMLQTAEILMLQEEESGECSIWLPHH